MHGCIYKHTEETGCKHSVRAASSCIARGARGRAPPSCSPDAPGDVALLPGTCTGLSRAGTLQLLLLARPVAGLGDPHCSPLPLTAGSGGSGGILGAGEISRRVRASLLSALGDRRTRRPGAGSSVLTPGPRCCCQCYSPGDARCPSRPILPAGASCQHLPAGSPPAAGGGCHVVQEPVREGARGEPGSGQPGPLLLSAPSSLAGSTLLPAPQWRAHAGCRGTSRLCSRPAAGRAPRRGRAPSGAGLRRPLAASPSDTAAPAAASPRSGLWAARWCEGPAGRGSPLPQSLRSRFAQHFREKRRWQLAVTPDPGSSLPTACPGNSSAPHNGSAGSRGGLLGGGGQHGQAPPPPQPHGRAAVLPLPPCSVLSHASKATRVVAPP